MKPQYVYALTGPRGRYDEADTRSIVIDGLRDSLRSLASSALWSCSKRSTPRVAQGRGARRAPIAWPERTLQLGLTDQPGGAAALAAIAPLRS